MKKTLFLIALVAVVAGCSKFDELQKDYDELQKKLAQQQEEINGQQQEISDHENLPNNIILTTRQLEDVIKGDTVSFGIVVNPSNFDISKGEFSLLGTNTLFTKYDVSIDPQTREQVETPFDENAHCDLKIVSLFQNPEYEGSYTMKIAVSGEGNFFSDGQYYVLFNAQDSTGKVRSICSNTPVDVSVIPWLEEAFRIEAPNQSFYMINLEQRKEGDVKPYGIGIWMNWYKSREGGYRVYERKKVQEVSLGNLSLLGCGTFDSEKFQSEGFVAYTPKTSEGFWADALAEDPVSVAIDTARITLRRGPEEKELGFTYRTFIHSLYEKTIKTTLAQIKDNGKKVTCDISQDLSNAGIDDSLLELSNISSLRTGVMEEGGQGDISRDGTTLTMAFWSTRFIEENNGVRGAYFESYRWKSGQQENGQFLPTTEQFTLIDFLMLAAIDTTE